MTESLGRFEKAVALQPGPPLQLPLQLRRRIPAVPKNEQDRSVSPRPASRKAAPQEEQAADLRQLKARGRSWVGAVLTMHRVAYNRIRKVHMLRQREALALKEQDRPVKEG